MVRGRLRGDVLRGFGSRSRRRSVQQSVVVDAGAWTTTIATPDAPLDLPADEEVLVPLSLGEWAASWLNAGAEGVLTPSRFVPSGDWSALKAVLVAGAQASDPRVATLVATDAVMLGSVRLEEFLLTVDEQRGGRPLAFVFAASSSPLASRTKVVGLRALLGAFPGSLVVGCDVLVGTDVVVHRGVAAVGLRSSQRRPRRPQDGGGGPPSKGWMPGMFLRELWETHSPSIYADWYSNRPAPVCTRCGRGPESFTADAVDKDAVLVHNVHAWLDVLTELRLQGENARAWLIGERWRAQKAHRDLGPRSAGVPMDPLLAALCALDGPPRHRRPAPAF